MNLADLLIVPLARLDLFVPLAVSHFLADFTFLQPDAMAASKRRGFRSPLLPLHAAIAAVLAWGLLGFTGDWWILPIVFATHYLIDGCKAWFADDTQSFLVDQVLHLAVLAGLVVAIARAHPFAPVLAPSPVYVWLLIGLLVWSVEGRLIAKIVEPWRARLAGGEGEEDELPNAGLWIGRLERILVVVFMLLGQLEAIGFLVAAKSVFRFSGERKRQTAEYVLVGTLLSFLLALATGLLAARLLR